MVPLRQPIQRQTVSLRSATKGYALVPNSIIENSSLLTPAELLLVLVTCRIQDTQHRMVSDSTWEKWTGKKAGIKRRAILGLSERGLSATGRGDRVRLSFDRRVWDDWVSQRGRHERARTVGRTRSVSAKPGQMIHPECKERGCQRLCESEQKENCEVISISATPNRQPVNNFANTSPPESPPNLQSNAASWPLALAAVRRFFGWADENFISRLVSAVHERIQNFTDEQLAKGVQLAKTENQKSEGLFLYTVPARVAWLISQPGISGTHRYTPAQQDSTRDRLELIANTLSRAGFSDQARSISTLDETADDLLERVWRVRTSVLEILRARVPRDVVRAAVEPQIKPHRDRMSREQLAELESSLIARRLLEDAGIDFSL